MGTTPVEAGSARLSPRELEVARLVSEGLTNREIGERLFISERTVDGHLEHVREKLDVNTRAQVSAWVVRQAAPDAVAPPPQPTVRTALPATFHVRRPVWVAAVLVVAILATVVVVRLNQPVGPVIVTVAGTGYVSSAFPGGGYSGDTGLAVHAQLSRPSDIAVASDGTMYIADYGNAAIRKVDNNQIITTVVGGGLDPLVKQAAATRVELPYASAVAVAPGTNRLFLLAILAGDLEVWSVQDSYLNFEVSLGPTRGASSVAYGLPVGGLVVAADGTVYVADRSENRVWKWSPPANPEVYAGTGETGFSGEGGSAKGAKMDWPIGLALDPRSGDLYIADSGNNCIRKVDTTQRITKIAGMCGEFSDDSGDGGRATEAHLSFPYGVAIGRGGTLFIADTANNQIRAVNRAGVIDVFAGTGVTGLGGDGGSALQADLAGPTAVTVDPRTGDLFIADTGNQRVRRVSGIAA